MNQYLSSNSLKSLAKGQLLGKYGTIVGALLLHMLCLLPLNSAIAFVIDTNSLLGIFVYNIAHFLFSLFNGYFLAGMTFIYLKIACNQIPYVKDLFHFFRVDSSKVIYIQAVIAGVSTLCSLPVQIVEHYLTLPLMDLSSFSLDEGQLPVNAPLFLSYAILRIAGALIRIYIQYLLLSQVFFLMLDFPEYTAPQLLKMSIHLMKGNKARMLYILLSFVPLLLLGFFSCGIAFLWLYPYIGVTRANFYLDLIKKKNQGI